MTDHEQYAITALSWVTYAPGTWDKRFARSLLEKPRNEPLSRKQRDQLWRLVYRYRGQLCRSGAGQDAVRLLLYPRGLTRLRVRNPGPGGTLYSRRIEEGEPVPQPTSSEQWQSCRDPLAMLPLVRDESTLQLFACAVWRVFSERTADAWEGEREERGRAIEQAEQYATGGRMLLLGEWVVQNADARVAALTTAQACRVVHGWEQADILRDVAADPFQVRWFDTTSQSSPQLFQIGDRIWNHDDCPWITTQVRTLARAARTGRLPDGSLDHGCLLALPDALEEAGCPETLILEHLRAHQERLRCHKCGGRLGRVAKKSTPAQSGCLDCWEPGPFWAVVCEGGPRRHWLGCWAVELCMGGHGRGASA